MNAPLRALSILAGLVLAAVGGYWFGRARPVAPAPVAAPAPAADLARMRSENQQLRAENEQLVRVQKEAALEPKRAVATNPAATGIEALSVLAELQRTKAGSVRVTMLERNSKLADGFVKLFQITPAERETLQQTLDDARDRTNKLAMANATVKVEGDALVAKMPPFEGGADVYDAVMDAFARTLGPARNEAFVALQAGQLSTALSGFGAEQRTVTVSREVRPDGESGLSVRDERRGPSGGGSSTMQSSMMNMNRLVEQYPWLESHVETIKSLPARPAPQRPAPTR
jgi:hypothetical protein